MSNSKITRLNKINANYNKNFFSKGLNNETFLSNNVNFLKIKANTINKHVLKESVIKPKSIDYFNPKEIIEKFSNYLNSFEQEEILHYKEIYYCGKYLKNKKQMININSNSNIGSSIFRNNTSTNEEEKTIYMKLYSFKIVMFIRMIYKGISHLKRVIRFSTDMRFLMNLGGDPSE